jgi:ribonuclease HI
MGRLTHPEIWRSALVQQNNEKEHKLSTDKIIIYTDGAARGNPGPAAIGVVLKDIIGNTITTVCRTLGVRTNNQAEYTAVITGLEKALSLGAKQVVLKSDSELVVKQLMGLYKVKNADLREMYQKVIALAGRLEKFSAVNIPREQNKQADALCNKALDGG